MTWLLELYLRMITPREDEDKGAAMVEYGLLVSLIALAAIVTIGFAGGAISDLFDRIATALGA